VTHQPIRGFTAEKGRLRHTSGMVPSVVIDGSTENNACLHNLTALWSSFRSMCFGSLTSPGHNKASMSTSKHTYERYMFYRMQLQS